MKRFRRRLLIGFVLLLATLVVGAAVWLWASLPVHEGRHALAGLGAKVVVVRDGNAIPHITALSRADAHFALGYVHAQDRLWQMEMARRAGAGRLAEVLGADVVASDKFMRTLGLARVAAANLEALDTASRALLDAYVAGVNAFLASDPVLPPEFTLFAHRPEPWTAVDSLLWPKLLALDLDGNWRREAGRLALSRRLSADRLAEFLPPYGAGEPQGVTPGGSAAVPALLRPRREGVGSNAWAVAGARTKSGVPLLANDPHLALRAPALWYLAHLSWPGGLAVGATIPGFPALVLGHNGHIAWSMTNTGTDLQDLFLEAPLAEDPERYRTIDGSAPFLKRGERIAVAGGDPISFTVRESRHGPIVSDLFDAAGLLGTGDRALALGWTGLQSDDTTLQAAFALAEARDWPAFDAALADFHAPQQSFLYADVAGNIGFLTPGRTPIRGAVRRGAGLWPVQGWTSEAQWRGFVLHEALPRSLNPPGGLLVTANQKIVTDDYPHHLSHEWSNGMRAARIAERLAGRRDLGLDDMAAVQHDTLSPLARALLGVLRRAARGSGDISRLLAAWDGTMASDRPEPLIFATWYQALTRLIYADEVGPLFPRYRALKPRFMLSVLTGENGHWCDDVTTAGVEDCQKRARAAFVAARAALVARHGLAARNWRWGRVRRTGNGHTPFSHVPPLHLLFDVRVRGAGDGTSVNAQPFSLGGPLGRFTGRHGPGFRAIYDLADLSRSRFVTATGQSGHPLSRHYRDMSRLWAAGDYVEISTAPEVFARAPSARLELVPLTPGRRSAPADR